MELMKQLESIKRVLVLQLNLVGLVMQAAVYGYAWYKVYKPLVRASISAIKYDGKGNLAMIGIYFVLLLFFSKTYGGTKIGYYRTLDVILSNIFALLCVGFLTFLQIALLAVWPVRRWYPERFLPMVYVTLINIAIALVWAIICQKIYRNVFPPRQLLLVHGDRPIESIVEKFESRKDKYIIAKSMHVKDGLEKIEEEVLQRYGGIILWDIPFAERNELIKYCYSNNIRIYMMPKIPDVLVKGAVQLHLFDTPILMVREYSLTVEQRFIKRLIDIVCALLLLIITSPFMLITAILVKCYDGGPIIYGQVRCTQGMREFKIYKFRSMRVDAEKDGVARLAAKNDDRITPIGKFIRKVRFDELPQLWNILKGDMSFIGPRPERPEIIKQYVEEMPEFVYRTKVRAGLAGFAQVYGKYNTTPYDKLKLDLFYIENYSVWLDLKLMLLTLKILVTPDATEGVEADQITALKQQKKEDE